jgi:hypothetical protein
MSAMPFSVFTLGRSYHHAARPQFVQFTAQVLNLPANLSLLVRRPRGARGDDDLRSAAALELDQDLVLDQDLEPELVMVEIPRLLEVPGQQDRMDRAVREHGFTPFSVLEVNCGARD